MARITRRSFATVAVAATASFAAPSAAPAVPRPGHRRGPELRGMWVASVENLDWPSRPGLSVSEQQNELVALLDTAVERRLNTVFLQVRPSADALWPSRYEPWSACLTGEQGRDPGWDPLAFAVTQAHRRRLRLHAWCNPYRVANHADLTRLTPDHPARRHPSWVVTHGGKLYYNPGLPQVRAFVQDAMFDAVERYDVDGLHFDDYFYPYPVPGEVFDDDAAYREYGAAFPDRGDWRRHNVDALVRETAARLRGGRPHLRFGISPFGVWRNRDTDPLGSDTAAGVQTYDDLYADTRTWVRRGWVDYVVPQLYWNIGFEAADYARLVPWWAQLTEGTDVRLYIGEGVYKVADPAQPAAWQDPAELSRHVALCREYPQVGGNVYFSAKDVVADRLGAVSRVVHDHYGGRARGRRP